MGSLEEVIQICAIYFMVLAIIIPLFVMTFVKYRILYRGLSPEKARNILSRRGELMQNIIYGVSLTSSPDDLERTNMGNLIFSTTILVILCLGLLLIVIGFVLGGVDYLFNKDIEGVIYLFALFMLVSVTLRGFYWGYKFGKPNKVKQ